MLGDLFDDGLDSMISREAGNNNRERSIELSYLGNLIRNFPLIFFIKEYSEGLIEK